MSFRTILVHLDNPERAESLLNIAAHFAMQHQAHLIGLYVVTPLRVCISGDIPIPVDMSDRHEKYHLQLASKLRDLFDTATANQEYVAEWRYVSAVPLSIAETISELAHTVDLVIMNQKETESEHITERYLPSQVLISSSRPVVVVPHKNTAKTTARNIVVAWDGGNAATRAVFDALPALRDADSVIVHRVNPSRYERHHLLGTPSELVNALTRHGVNVTLSQSDAAKGRVGEELFSVVKDSGADMLVMGAYGRNRLAEHLFGGTTKTVLAETHVPVMLSH